MWPNTGFDISLDSGSKDQGREAREQGPEGMGTWSKDQGNEDRGSLIYRRRTVTAQCLRHFFSGSRAFALVYCKNIVQ